MHHSPFQRYPTTGPSFPLKPPRNPSVCLAIDMCILFSSYDNVILALLLLTFEKFHKEGIRRGVREE
jgi:hypothetical protein